MSFEAKKDEQARPPEQLDFIYSAARRQSGMEGGEYKPLGYLLYLNPEGEIAAEPVIDEITGKITAAFRSSVENGISWRGFHMCTCGACSTNTDYILLSLHQTNSLAVHYVALHRGEVPEDQLDIIDGFNIEPISPAEEDLSYPPS